VGDEFPEPRVNHPLVSDRAVRMVLRFLLGVFLGSAFLWMASVHPEWVERMISALWGLFLQIGGILGWFVVIMIVWLIIAAILSLSA
jgi:hypothetical protein